MYQEAFSSDKPSCDKMPHASTPSKPAECGLSVFLNLTSQHKRRSTGFYSYFVDGSGKCIERSRLTESISFAGTIGG
jgi:hypothetical protein